MYEELTRLIHEHEGGAGATPPTTHAARMAGSLMTAHRARRVLQFPLPAAERAGARTAPDPATRAASWTEVCRACSGCKLRFEHALMRPRCAVYAFAWAERSRHCARCAASCHVPQPPPSPLSLTDMRRTCATEGIAGSADDARAGIAVRADPPQPAARQTDAARSTCCCPSLSAVCSTSAKISSR